MCNIGFGIPLARENVSLVCTRVGDRYVSDEMRRSGIMIRGEKSGHVVLSEHSTTGDDTVTILQAPTIMLETEKALSELAGQGRVFVRASGTERLIRVMAEGPDSA